jgi:hypothetical protein
MQRRLVDAGGQPLARLPIVQTISTSDFAGEEATSVGALHRLAFDALELPRAEASEMNMVLPAQAP